MEKRNADSFLLLTVTIVVAAIGAAVGAVISYLNSFGGLGYVFTILGGAMVTLVIALAIVALVLYISPDENERAYDDYE